MLSLIIYENVKFKKKIVLEKFNENHVLIFSY